MSTYIKEYVALEEQRIEKEIIGAAIQALLVPGFKLKAKVDSTAEFKFKSVRNFFKNLDQYYYSDVWIFVYKMYAEEPMGWVKLVGGNCEYVISDYTTNLEPYLAAANKLATRYE